MMTTVGVIFLPTSTLVDCIELNTVLQCALLDKLTLGNTGEGADKAVCKPQRTDRRGPWSGRGKLSIGREGQVGGTEDQDIPDTFFGTMFALDGGGLVGDADDHQINCYSITGITKGLT